MVVSGGIDNRKLVLLGFSSSLPLISGLGNPVHGAVLISVRNLDVSLGSIRYNKTSLLTVLNISQRAILLPPTPVGIRDLYASKAD